MKRRAILMVCVLFAVCLFCSGNRTAAKAEEDDSYAVGSYVTFGRYPQTEAGDDSTPIEWLVLDRDGEKALLISRYGLDMQLFNTELVFITWEDCTLRTWLNDTFLNTAFNKEEQTGILLTEVDNSESQGYSGYRWAGGNNTQDRIFLLSCAEASQYFGVQHYSISGSGDNMKARTAPTAYAKKTGAFPSVDLQTEDGDAASWWWLRSPGYGRDFAAIVYFDGSLQSSYVNYKSICVRPALWIDLASGIF